MRLSDSSIGDWLNGVSVPVDRPAFRFLITYLTSKAQQLGHQVHPLQWWLDLRARESQERHANRGGRPSAKRIDVDTDLERLGRAIYELTEADALALEVHQAIDADSGNDVPILPPYLPRSLFDDNLRRVVADAEQGSRMVVVVGDSSTGKTRACWEAIREALPNWRIWHPLTPERPIAIVEALRENRLAPRTVIWLNEAQSYLAPQPAGEQVASALQEMLTEPDRGPFLILGSMWPNYWQELTGDPSSATYDPHRAVRALLRLHQTITISIPAAFTKAELAALAELTAGDRRLIQATRHAIGGRITQYLAGAPELMRRYEQADEGQRAVLWAAMDARRLGHGPYLTEDFLCLAADAYLDQEAVDLLGEGWFAKALTALEAKHRHLAGPLLRRQPRVGDLPSDQVLYRLADFLDQHGRASRRLVCPPAAFWDAAARRARTPSDCTRLAQAAISRWRLTHAERLYRAAAEAGDPRALVSLALMRERAGDEQSAERFYQAAVEAGEGEALAELAQRRERAGDRQRAERLAYAAAHAGKPRALTELTWRREAFGDSHGAERLARAAAESGQAGALTELMWRRERAGDSTGAERLALTAVEVGSTEVLVDLASMRDRAGDRQGAERLYQMAVDAGDPAALVALARLKERAGDRQGAERLYQMAVDAGDPAALVALARLKERA
ncbi:hypothetical protein AB0F67_44085, partial [Nonomuraea dietziae]